MNGDVTVPSVSHSSPQSVAESLEGDWGPTFGNSLSENNSRTFPRIFPPLTLLFLSRFCFVICLSRLFVSVDRVREFPSVASVVHSPEHARTHREKDGAKVQFSAKGLLHFSP